MSDFVQIRRPEGYLPEDDWEQEMQDAPLSSPAYYHEIEADIIGDTREMLQSVADAVETLSQAGDEMPQHVAGTIAALDTLTPSDVDDGEGFRANPESAFYQTPAILVGLLDRFTEAWGYGDRAPFQANELQRLRYLIIAKMLSHFEERFGLASISAIVGKDVEPETMNVVEQLPAERGGETPGKVARIIHLGFIYNDGAIWRQADVAQFISQQEDAARHARERYSDLLIR